MKKTHVLALAALLAASLAATAADEPKPGWHGSFGAGLSINSGNSDAKSFNLGFDLKYDPKTKNVVKIGGLYLRSDSNGVTTGDKLTAFARDEYSFTDRFFVYGEVSFLRDKLALLDSLFAPAAGAGYKLVKTDAMTFDVSAGLGGAFEKYARAGRNLERRIPRGRGLRLEGLPLRHPHAEGDRTLEGEGHRRRLLPLRGRPDDLALEAPRAEARVPRRPQDPAGHPDAREDRHGVHRGPRREVLASSTSRLAAARTAAGRAQRPGGFAPSSDPRRQRLVRATFAIAWPRLYFTIESFRDSEQGVQTRPLLPARMSGGCIPYSARGCASIRKETPPGAGSNRTVRRALSGFGSCHSSR